MQKIAYKFIDKQTRLSESPESKVADEIIQHGKNLYPIDFVFKAISCLFCWLFF